MSPHLQHYTLEGKHSASVLCFLGVYKVWWVSTSYPKTVDDFGLCFLQGCVLTGSTLYDTAAV